MINKNYKMEMSGQQKRYKKAKKRVEEEKGFHTHLMIYIVINIIILFVNTNFYGQGFRAWLQWHLYITPVFWGIGLLFHGLKTFNKKISFFRDWEERKIRELMNDDDF